MKLWPYSMLAVGSVSAAARSSRCGRAMSLAVPGRTCIRPTAPAGLTASARKVDFLDDVGKASAGSIRQPLRGIQRGIGIAVGGIGDARPAGRCGQARY